VPDVFAYILIPPAFTVLFVAGAIQLVLNRKAFGTAVPSDTMLLIGTTVCGALMALTVAISIWWNFFFNLNDF